MERPLRGDAHGGCGGRVGETGWAKSRNRAPARPTFTARLCINGNEWAKRQAAKAGIEFEALDNGFAAVDDVDRLQAICDSLGPEQIEALLRKWLRILPTPFTDADDAAGYRYDLSLLQTEFSLTQMLDTSVSGRIFFEQVLHDNLDAGRPDRISLVFDRRIIRKGKHPTPGRFRTRVITAGVTPSLHIDYKHTTVKQYHNCDARSHAASDYVDRRSGLMPKT